MEQDEPRQAPLAQLEDQEELKKRYAFVSSRVLRRWMSVVVGPHREAMAALLRERGENVTGPDGA